MKISGQISDWLRVPDTLGLLLRLMLSACFFCALPLSASTAETQLDALRLAATDNPASTQGLTRQQGDQILRELRAIRKLLQQQQATAKTRKPAPTRASIKLAQNHLALGRPDAPVTLVEFTDYQCPFCKQFHDNTFPSLVEHYIKTGKLRYISMDLPLPFHQQARPAANAARCAADQGRFWQMRQLLFANPKALDRTNLIDYAGTLSLDLASFQQCLADKRHDAEIQQDIKTAGEAGFTGTPSFVIGRNRGGQVDGMVLIGAKPLAEFENLIRRYSPTPKNR